MKKIIIDGTKHTPHVELDPSGEIVIQGRSTSEDPLTFYNPILSWVKGCSSVSLNLMIKLEYVNTPSTKQIFNLLHLVRQNKVIKNVFIGWYYQDDDEDILELGKEIESLIELPFVFHKYSDSTV